MALDAARISQLDALSGASQSGLSPDRLSQLDQLSGMQTNAAQSPISIQTAISNAMGDVGKQVMSPYDPNLSFPGQTVEKALAVGSIPLRVAGAVGSSVLSNVPPEVTAMINKIPLSTVSDPVGTIVRSVQGSPNPTIGDVSNAVQQTGQAVNNAYQPWAANHPQTAAAVGQLGTDLNNLGMVTSTPALADLGAKGIVAGASNAGDAIGNMATGLDNALGQTIRPTAADLKAVSQAGYANATAQGGVIPAEQANSIIDNFQKILPQSDKETAAFGINPAQQLAKNLDAYRNAPMTLDDATVIDKRLGDFINGPGTSEIGKLNPDGYAALQMQKQLRSSLQGFDGGPTYQQAVKDWSAQSQTSDIQRIIDRANMSDNSATVLKNGFKSIATNPGRLSQYPADVQSAIKSAANDGMLSNLLRTQLGSRLLAGIGGAAGGGLPGMVAGELASSGARSGAEMLQMGRANKVLDAIAGNSSLPTQTIPLSQILKLPPAQARALLKVKP